MRCPSCGQENPEGFRFCGSCGAPLSGTPRTAVEERKVVTVLFCDLVGFTARSDEADPEDVRALLRPYHERLRREIERLGGTVDKFVGDGVMAVFGVPSAHEDDPERAVRCALRVLDAIAELNQAAPELELAVRIGVMTGEAAVILDPRPHETEGVVGDVVNTASRLQGTAPTGTVVVGEPTWWATRTAFHYEKLEPVQVKGKAKPLPVWRAVAPRSRLGVDVEQRPATPLVGRDQELDLLRRLYQQTRRARAVQLVAIVGEPGIGKSRLVRELLRFVDEQPELVVWRQGHCLSYGDGITFWALGEIVKAQAGVLESDDAALVTAKLTAAVAALVADQDEREWLQLRLAPLLGLASGDIAPAEQAEQFTAWRRFLEAVAASGPLILVVEDLHWADDALLAFLEYLVGAVRGVALLVVTTARPELFERHPGWPQATEHSTVIPLAALEAHDTARLMGSLLGRSRLAAEIEASLLERADGNPLYAEEYIRLLADRGLLAAPDRLWGVSGAGLPFPPTVQALIAARLDALPGQRKALLQDAAVVGKVFWSGALVAMAGLDRDTVRAELGALQRAELVRTTLVSSVHGQEEYAFWHALVRDVAYGQLPRAERVRRHQAAGAWIEGLAGARLIDHAELLAHHFTKALELIQLARVTPPQAQLNAIQERARRFLVLAGDRTMHLDVTKAVSYYQQALALHPEERPDHARVLIKAAEAAREGGHNAQAERAYKEAVARARAQHDLRAAGGALLGLAQLLRNRGEMARARMAIDEALQLLAPLPPSVERADAYTQLSFRELAAGHLEQAVAWANKTLALASETDIGPTRFRALEQRGLARSELGDVAGLDDVRAAMGSALELGLTVQGVSIANNLGEHQWPIQGPAASLETLEWGFELASQRGLAEAAMYLRTSALGPQFDLGDWDRLLQAAEEVRSWSERQGVTHLRLWAEFRQAEVLLHRGERARAAALAARFLPGVRAVGELETLAPALTIAALIEQAQGGLVAAGRLVDELSSATTDRSAWPWAKQLPDLVRLCVATGRHQLAGDLIDRAQLPAARHHHARRTTQAVMAEASGDQDRAARAYGEAATRWANYGHLFERGRALLGLGRCLLLQHELDAQHHVQQAREVFTRLGARPFLAEADYLLSRLEALTRTQPPRPDTTATTRFPPRNP
jgi:class 3 adenylate cyclase/tetratricopeptide (TPR) repeat protein